MICGKVGPFFGNHQSVGFILQYNNNRKISNKWERLSLEAAVVSP